RLPSRESAQQSPWRRCSAPYTLILHETPAPPVDGGAETSGCAGEVAVQHRVLTAGRYYAGRFSSTSGFSAARMSPRATLSSGSSQKNVRTQLLYIVVPLGRRISSASRPQASPMVLLICRIRPCLASRSRSGGTARVQIGRIGAFSIRPSWLTASFGHSLISTRVSGIGHAS